MKGKKSSIYALFQTLLNKMLLAEEDILKQLKIVSKAADSEDLKMIFDRHSAETNQQVQRLKDSLEYLESKTSEEESPIEKGKKVLKTAAKKMFHKKSEAIDGIITEGEHVFKEYAKTNLHDYVIATGAQSLEMGEIAAYKTLISLAKDCGLKEIERSLQTTLQEEIKAYDLLKAFSEEEAKRIEKSA